MGDCSDETRLAANAEDIERLTREGEFWYLATKALIGAIIKTTGSDAADLLIEHVHERSLEDFSQYGTDARLTDPVASEMLERLRRVAEVWAEHGTMNTKAREGKLRTARGDQAHQEEEPSDV
jgi:dsRNA-specific ribonuclease